MIVIKLCYLCKKIKHCPYQMTFEKDGDLSLYPVCAKCKKSDIDESKNIDFSNVNTPAELLDLIESIFPSIPPCDCGLTEAEFDINGKFGCDKCYDHFHKKMEELVFPYHKGEKAHFGKRPLRKSIEGIENDPIKKRQFLKLQLARAVEFEEYEKASVIKKQISELDSCLP